MSLGEQEIGFVYIDDVIKGYSIAINKLFNMEPGEQKTFFITPKIVKSLKEVAVVFEKVSGEKLNINWGKRPY